MTLKNLVAGQYQIDDLIFGRGTTVRVENFDIKPYDINSQDYQITRADEINFGWDQLKPTTIEITFHVLNNYLLPGFEDLIPNFWEEMPTVDDFQESWRFDDGRYQWGAMKSLYVCDRKGITKEIFGRPGQFTPGVNTRYTESVQVIVEWRRADTYAYGVVNNVSPVITTADLDKTLNGTEGNGPSWLALLLQGPVTNPTITLDGLCNQPNPVTFTLNRTVTAGEVIEINGQPWSRRAVSSTGENVSADLSEYLDKLRFYHNRPLDISLAGGGMTTETALVGVYRDAYQVIA